MSSSADQLAQEVTTARVQEFGDDDGTERFPGKFFNSGVTVTAPNGQLTPRAPRYCATNYGAAAIARVLLDNDRPCDLMLGGATGPEKLFVDSEPVPYCQFKADADPDQGPYTGTLVNAALILDNFNHGNSGAVSLGRALEEVDAAVAGPNAPVPQAAPKTAHAKPETHAKHSDKTSHKK